MAQNTNRDPENKEVQVTGSEGGSVQGRQVARASRAAELLPARLFSRGGPFSPDRSCPGPPKETAGTRPVARAVAGWVGVQSM